MVRSPLAFGLPQQEPPLPEGFRYREEPPEGFVSKESLMQRAQRAIFETGYGPAEGIANIGLGATGWMAGQAFGYGKLLYDTWRTGGRGVSWQDFENDFRNASQLVSSLGGIYQPQTQMGKDIAQLAGMPFAKAEQYWGKIVDAMTDDPEKRAALKTVGGTAIGLLLGRVAFAGIKGVKGKVRDIMTDVPASKIAFPTQELAQRVGVVKEMSDAIRNLEPAMKQQEMARRKQYAQKFAGSRLETEKIAGEAGARAAISKMGGEMEKVGFDYQSIRNLFTQDKLDYLHNEIHRTPLLDQGQKLTAYKALLDIFHEEGANLPQAKALYYLSRVFGKDFVSAVRKNWDTWSKVKHHVVETVNIPRSLVASFDASAPFRQGLMMIGRKEFWNSFKEMFRILKGKGEYESMMADITSRDTYKLMLESGLEITEMPSEAPLLFGKDAQAMGKMGMREEPFYSHYAEQIPLGIGKGVQISGRLYTGFLNKLRADVFDSLLMDAERLGLNPKSNPKLTQDIATFINSATGRGKLKARHAETATFLNTFFFSPRLIKARLDFMNPGWYMKLDPFARKQALKSLATVTSAGLTTLGLAKLAGLDVGTDIHSADFGKIKVGNTRIDIWGGQQQYIVPIARILSGKYTSSTTGKRSKLGEGIFDPTRYDIALRSIEYKESPFVSFATALLKGKDVRGKPIKIEKEALERLTPLVIQDFIDIAKDDPELLPIGLLGVFGMGVQTYEPRKKLVR